MEKKLISEELENEIMLELGFTWNQELGKFFLGESAFLGNVDDEINEVNDLILDNSNNPSTLLAESLIYQIENGAEFIIGKGAIDEYGQIHKKGLYCTNYKNLFSKADKKKYKQI